MKKPTRDIAGTVGEFRVRVELLSGYSGETYFSELKELVDWITRVPFFQPGIKELDEREVKERVEREDAAKNLFDLTVKTWLDTVPLLGDEAKKYIDSTTDETIGRHVDGYADFLTSAINTVREYEWVQYFHQVRGVIEGLARSSFKSVVAGYVNTEGTLFGDLQNNFVEYVKEDEKFDRESLRSAWGYWMNLKWVYNRLSYPLAIQISKHDKEPVRKKDDLFRLTKLAQHFFDYNLGLLSEETLVDDSIDKRIWRKDFGVVGEELNLAEFGKLRFDPRRRDDGGEGGEGTDAARFLKEVVDTGLTGVGRGSIISIEKGAIAGHMANINTRLSNAFRDKNIAAFCELKAIGSPGSMTIYFCIYPPSLYKKE
jgi:hypothetical protein